MLIKRKYFLDKEIIPNRFFKNNRHKEEKYTSVSQFTLNRKTMVNTSAPSFHA